MCTEADFDMLVKTFRGLIAYNIERYIDTCGNNKNTIKNCFIEFINRKYEYILINVVKEKYPQYLEMLEKII